MSAAGTLPASSALLALRFPRRFADAVLSRGTFPRALGCVALALVFSTLAALRVATTITFEETVFGSNRSEFIDGLLRVFGRDRTAVLVYLMQRTFDAVIVASATTPLFIWLLGSSAVHAAARLRGIRGRVYLPVVVLFGYAALAYQVPVSVAGLLFGMGRGAGQIPSAIALLMLVWLGFVVHHGIERHYSVSGRRATWIFVIAVLLFYLLPGLLILGAFVAVLVAAIVLEYF